MTLSSEHKTSPLEHSYLGTQLQFVLGALCLYIYTLTLCPTVPGGDSGELIAVAHNLGIAHPPGYPLYTVLGKLFTYLPYGSIAWRVNFLSAVCNVGAALVLFRLTREQTKNSWIAFLVGGMFAFSPLIWRYSVVAEVFALNNLFVAILLFLYTKIQLTRELGKERFPLILAGAFCVGLALTNHHTFIFVALPLCISLLIQERRWLWTWKHMGALLLAGLVGLIPYLYLVVAAKSLPIISWTDTSTWSGFWGHLLRKDYGTFKLGAMPKKDQLLHGLWLYLTDTPREFLYFGFLMPFIGIYALWRKPPLRTLVRWPLLALALYLVVFHFLANLPLEQPLFYQVHIRFWQQANVLLFFFMGPGLLFFWEKTRPERRFVYPFIFSFVVALQVVVNFSQEDQHENWTTHLLGKAVLEVLPENAIFLSLGDVYTNSIRYLQQCEGMRKDVKILDRELMKKGWFTELMREHHPEVKIPGPYYRPALKEGAKGYSLAQFLEANIDRYPIYAASFKKDSPEGEDKAWSDTYYRLPYGTIHRFFRATEPLNLKKYLSETNAILNNFKRLHFAKAQLSGSWENLIQTDFKNASYMRARQLLYLAQKANNQTLIKTAIPLFEDVAKHHPNPPWENFKLLGASYNWLEKKEKGHIEGMLKAWDKYFELAPYNEEDRPAIEKSYKHYKEVLARPVREKKSPSKNKHNG